MFLSGEKIKQAIESKKLFITPFSEDNLKLVSYTFTLSNKLLNPLSNTDIILSDAGYLLKPGEFVIGKTHEYINLNNKYLCILGTRSKLAQQGIDALLSSTIAEPDTNGQFTLEIINNSGKNLLLTAGMPIVKGIFAEI